MNPLTPGHITVLSCITQLSKNLNSLKNTHIFQNKIQEVGCQDHEQGAQHVPIDGDGVGDTDSKINESQPDSLIYL